MKLNERTHKERKPGTMPEGARRASETVRRVELPFMGSAVMAGFPSPAEQYVERPLDLNELLVARPADRIGGWESLGKNIHVRVKRWTGIPCGVGSAKTRTLAKIANHIGKKRPGGVFVMPEDASGVLAGLPVGEVWGVGRRLAERL